MGFGFEFLKLTDIMMDKEPFVILKFFMKMDMLFKLKILKSGLLKQKKMKNILLMKMDIYTEEFHLQQKVILKVNLFYLIFLDYFQMQM